MGLGDFRLTLVVLGGVRLRLLGGAVPANTNVLQVEEITGLCRTLWAAVLFVGYS